MTSTGEALFALTPFPSCPSSPEPARKPLKRRQLLDLHYQRTTTHSQYTQSFTTLTPADSLTICLHTTCVGAARADGRQTETTFNFNWDVRARSRSCLTCSAQNAKSC